MTSAGIEKQRDNAVPPLPHLPVLRGTWCPQADTDRAIDFLQANNPELIAEMLVEEGASRSSDYFNVAFEVLDYLSEAGQPVPATLLGKLDLAYELSRRIRKANGLSEFRLRGTQAGEGPDKPAPLPSLAVSEGATKRGNVTQELADKILKLSYDQRPDLWFAASEEYRHDICIYATDELRETLRKIVDDAFGPTRNNWTAGEIFIEAVRRIYKMCGIDE